MRIQTVAAGIALTLIGSGCSKTPEYKLIGEWKGTDFRGQTASLLVKRDRSVRIGIRNLVLDGTMPGGGAKAKLRVSFRWRADPVGRGYHPQIGRKDSRADDYSLHHRSEITAENRSSHAVQASWILS